jgi:hypothetical protein
MNASKRFTEKSQARKVPIAGSHHSSIRWSAPSDPECSARDAGMR